MQKLKSEFVEQLGRMYARRKRAGIPQIAPIGFDYATALDELSKVYRQAFLLGELGYKLTSRDVIRDIKDGTLIPNHLAGEALYVLYTATFPKRPVPMHPLQKAGLTGEEEKKFLVYIRSHQYA